MKKQDALDSLAAHREEMVRRFKIKRLAIFGSTARDEARADSDVDVLVEFEGPATFDGYMGLKLYLEELFHTHVDLVTPPSIRPRMRPMIEKDSINAA